MVPLAYRQLELLALGMVLVTVAHLLCLVPDLPPSPRDNKDDRHRLALPAYIPWMSYLCDTPLPKMETAATVAGQ